MDFFDFPVEKGDEVADGAFEIAPCAQLFICEMAVFRAKFSWNPHDPVESVIAVGYFPYSLEGVFRCDEGEFGGAEVGERAAEELEAGGGGGVGGSGGIRGFLFSKAELPHADVSDSTSEHEAPLCPQGEGAGVREGNNHARGSGAVELEQRGGDTRGAGHGFG